MRDILLMVGVVCAVVGLALALACVWEEWKRGRRL